MVCLDTWCNKPEFVTVIINTFKIGSAPKFHANVSRLRIFPGIKTLNQYDIRAVMQQHNSRGVYIIVHTWILQTI